MSENQVAARDFPGIGISATHASCWRVLRERWWEDPAAPGPLVLYEFSIEEYERSGMTLLPKSLKYPDGSERPAAEVMRLGGPRRVHRRGFNFHTTPGHAIWDRVHGLLDSRRWASEEGVEDSADLGAILSIAQKFGLQPPEPAKTVAFLEAALGRIESRLATIEAIEEMLPEEMRRDLP